MVTRPMCTQRKTASFFRPRDASSLTLYEMQFVVRLLTDDVGRLAIMFKSYVKRHFAVFSLQYTVYSSLEFKTQYTRTIGRIQGMRRMCISIGSCKCRSTDLFGRSEQNWRR